MSVSYEKKCNFVVCLMRLEESMLSELSQEKRRISDNVINICIKI